MNRIKPIIIMLLLLTLPEIAPAGPETGASLTLTARVDRTTVRVGDTVTYVLVSSGSSSEVAPPRFPDFEGFRVVNTLSSTQITFVNGQVRTVQQHQVELVPERSGDLVIGPALLSVPPASGEEGGVIRTDPVRITVLPANAPSAPITPVSPVIPEEEDGLRDIKGPFAVGWGVWPWVSLTLILAGAGAFAGHVWFRRHKVLNGPAGLPTRSPEETAMNGLKNAFKQRAAVDPGPFYSSMSSILRHYWAERYALEAPPRTTREILGMLATRGLSREDLARIRSFLEDCDLVKFAKQRPSGPDRDRDYERAVQIVRMKLK